MMKKIFLLSLMLCLTVVSAWADYSYTDENGNQLSYYLYPGDVENVLADDSAYGYAAQASADYYPGLIRRVRAVSADGLEDLVSILEAAQAVEQRARAELEDQQYSYDDEADKYELTHGQELSDLFYDVYGQFSQWLTRYQL